MTSDQMDLQSSPSSDASRSSTTFHANVYIVNLERASLSRKLERVQCILACDDSASVNLYLDQRQELDYIQFRLTHGIRQIHLNDKTATIKVQLSTQQRLEITPDPRGQCQALYDLLLHVKARPSDIAKFPLHQPKVGILKPDSTTAYLIVNDIPSSLDFRSHSTASTIPSTPSKRKSVILEQTHKKSRVQKIECSSHTYRQSKEAYDPILSSPVGPDDSPDRWRPPSSPTYQDEPRKRTQKPYVLENTGDSSNHLSTKLYTLKPQFHSTVPTPRVLRSINDRIRRYGRDAGTRKSKRLSSPDRASNARCIPAVLRALFSMEPFARDLRDPYWLRMSGTQHSLYRSLVESYTPYSENTNRDVKIDAVSENVIKTSKGKLGDEDDAREFLNDTLNQVRQEFRERNIDSPCPLSRLFECNIEHRLECMNCGNEIVHTEHYQDFCLELPPCDSNRSSQPVGSIGGLFPQFFDTQHISFECEACRSESAIVRRSISKLPDVLVVYLKRFTARPSYGYNKNRSRITIDETLEFSQFCAPAAFISDNDALPTMAQHSEDDGYYGHPYVPSDSPPSSSSQWFSSISPVSHDDFFSSSISPHGQHEYIDADLYNHHAQGTAANPHLLNSDDEDDSRFELSQSISVYDPPSEDEQYQWAMEESIRESKSFSQESIFNEKIADGAKEALWYKNLGSKEVIELDEPFLINTHDNSNDGNNDNGKDKDKDKDEGRVRTGKSVLKTNDFDTFEPVDMHLKDKAHHNEDEDELIKAAIHASLMTTDGPTPGLSDKELQEEENKQLEEAIRRSLMDSEENKENISPEKRQLGKKKDQKDKQKPRPPGLTRSCSQIYTATPNSLRGPPTPTTRPPRLQRANTVDVIASSQQSSREDSLSEKLSAKRSVQGPRSGRNRTEEAYLPNNTTSSSNTNTNPTTVIPNDSKHAARSNGKDKGKGKEKDYNKVEAATQGSTIGLFQLQAMVSHTGLISSTSEGHYVCDSLGADGVWRCYDVGQRTKIGSIADLSQYRGRSGYLFFYVHCYSKNSLVVS
ncbi:hypothetical protein BCR41DRAFT_363122 [Lobosporangium transversale]|uniref:USP domain-containing protein n=1 Tax=Lobosporangium transversale TaxID=64571 RepID=A0A1Y2G8A1_9FUNG|nr:hypothetical protein BCR41DRAFT_363122 [Lobosporangium transversale]ORZ04064.1 hypothetical protein BCR41DRAFT_363122 [Lobosporangium transversale]|eukprot:XP_021876341.1 hypothetical protein BCR41DRAFT_363122 [Lobosporangium transversale]